MHIAILTFEGFNELDALVAPGRLNRVKQPGSRVDREPHVEGHEYAITACLVVTLDAS